MHLPAATRFEEGRPTDESRAMVALSLFLAPPQLRGRCSQNNTRSIKHEGPQRVAGGDEQILTAVQAIGNRGVGDVADARVPERLAREGVVRHDVAARVAGE